MFDTVAYRCQHCGAHQELQTKAGDCCLEVFSIASVPVDIAKSLDGQKIYCSNCRKVNKLSWPKTAPKHVSMVVEESKMGYDWDDEAY